MSRNVDTGLVPRELEEILFFFLCCLFQELNAGLLSSRSLILNKMALSLLSGAFNVWYLAAL